MSVTRRDILKRTIGGIALTITPLSLNLGTGSAANAAEVGSSADWQAGPGAARFRIDGHRKVTGGKIYARDFRARDLDGWPDNEDVVMVLRTPTAMKVFEGIDLTGLPDELQPKSMITAEDLSRDNVAIAREDFPAGDYLATAGEPPLHIGQAVGLLFYDSFFSMDKARRAIRALQNRGVRVGQEVAAGPDGYYEPDTRFIRARENQVEVFSQYRGGPVQPDDDNPTERDARALQWANRISAKLENAKALGWTTLSRSYETQVADPMFMEPESGLAWCDRNTGTLHIFIGTQSPSYDAESALAVVSGPLSSFGIKRVNVIAAYPGGGFGGRDTSILSIFLALAAVYSDKPIRIVYDRFDQFQSGIKQHASSCELDLAVDEDNNFTALRHYVYLNGGGRRNTSTYVAQVAGLDATGPYRIPLVDIWSRAMRTRAMTAGSMRGFGTTQSVFAIDTLIDEMAEKRGVDPIELRRTNALEVSQIINTGAPVAPPGLVTMCESAAKHRLWTEREARREAAEGAENAYGVGFALGMKNYGTGADAVLADVAIGTDGKITLKTHAVDMGTGTSTVLALATARSLGANATTVDTGLMDHFNALKLEPSFTMQASNPRWTPMVFESTKAASTSSKWVHGVEQAALVLFLTGLLPAAREIWGGTAQFLDADETAWENGALTAPGRTAIPLADLARHAHDKGYVVSAMVHGFYSGLWVEADYPIGNDSYRLLIDALSIQRGGKSERELIDRQNPRLYNVESMWEGDGQNFAASACLAAVKVNRRTGEVRVDEAVHYLAPGKVLQQDLLEGQMDGAFAMGVGQALLEYLPIYEDGAGNGQWNLHRYHVPLSGDVALNKVEKVILPPERDDAPARGIAEVTMVPVAPAITNAVAHATGVRIRRLPITSDDVRAAWRGE